MNKRQLFFFVVFCLLVILPRLYIFAATSTIWPSTAVPSLVDGGADNPVELGVRFQSDVDGVVSGIRFYKAATNTGTHVANLWSSAGAKLATATFTGETASGWQQMNFTTPAAITANTVYVASYHANNGHYSADLNYFSASGVDNSPLHALKNGVSGGNGLYTYGASSAFPTSTWNTCNYWVDVVFQPGSTSDTTPPTVQSVNPVSGASGVSASTAITITFSEAMNASSVNANSILLRDASNNLVPATVTYGSTTQTATLTPSNSLQAAASYSATVKGGSGGVTDTAGNAMSADFAWTFKTTGSYGALGGGPGGPILVVSGTANPFSRYYGEILVTEGLNEFSIADISSVSSTTLAQYDVVILGQIALTSSQVSMFTNWVNGGGKLIAMRPDKQLAGLLGLADAGSTLSQGYLLVNTAAGPGQGIVGQTMQFHGTADRYTLTSGSSVATLYSNSNSATVNPAVTLRAVGSNGGQAAAFTYDLAQSVVFTRQGNPAWAGQARDGLAVVRPADLFYGAASFDPQPDWVDLNKVAIPQADEQQRLLANMVISMNSSKKLLPRFWYFPHGYQAVVVMTGDDHSQGGTAGRFSQYLALSASNGSLADWETIRSSSYVFPYSGLSDAQAAAYNALGFEIALHLNTNCTGWDRASLDDMFTDQLAQFKALYPSLPAPTTHRVHCVAWSDYTTMAEVELLHGIRLDTSYYYYPPSWMSDKPGVFTGSGLPMRFAKADGSVIDVYQATTQMTDESGQAYPATVDALLDKALGSEGYYGAFVANMHTDEVYSEGSDAILASSINRDVPVISARQLLVWSDARNGSSIQSLAWSSGTMSFVVNAAASATGLQGMAPVLQGSTVSDFKYNGHSLQPSFKKVKGIEYAIFPALSGTYQIAYAQDTTAPTVSSIQPPQGGSGVSLDADVVVAFSEAMDQSTVNGSTIILRDAANTLVPATVSFDPATFAATLTPSSRLTASTAYTATVKSGTGGVTDSAGNPLASDVKATFTTGSAAGQSYTIWSNAATPGILAADDTNAVELGLKFKSSTSGTATAIRFYKSVANTGSHIGNLWSAAGTRLATVNFTGETSSGWQTQALSTPVAIAANTVYIVSYHTNVGLYSADNNYFAAAGVDNTPLHALKNGESGGNGVYLYGSASGFPNQTWNSSNYWVDIVFSANP